MFNEAYTRSMNVAHRHYAFLNLDKLRPSGLEISAMKDYILFETLWVLLFRARWATRFEFQYILC